MSGLLINLLIQIVSGAIGGNVAAGAAKNIDLGTLGNTLAGAIGGGAGDEGCFLRGGGHGGSVRDI